jgi:hypothetical protein
MFPLFFECMYLMYLNRRLVVYIFVQHFFYNYIIYINIHVDIKYHIKIL